MKKYSMLITCLIIMVFQPLAAGDSVDHPLAESRVLRYGGGDEIIGFTGSVITVSKYFHAMEVTPTDTVLTVLTYQTGWNWWEPSVVTTINVNDNELSDIVAVRVNYSGNIDIVALRADPNLLSVDTLANWEIETEIMKTGLVRFRDSWYISSHPMLFSGDFSGDGTDEFVLGYWAEDAQQNTFLYLVVYDADIDLVVSEIASVMDQPVAVQPVLEGFEAEFTIYDMTTGDFNGDGKHEILLTGREARESGGWNLFASVYAYEPGNNTLARMLKDTLVTVTDDMSELNNVKITSGYLNNSDRQQAVVYYSLLNKKEESYEGTIYFRPDTSYSYMVALAFDEALSYMMQSTPYLQGIGSSSVYPEVYLTLKSRDINGSGFEEIFSGFNPYSLYWGDDEYFRIYQLDDQFQFIEYANLDYINPYQMTLGNVILDTTGEADSPEIIVGSFPVVVYTIDIDDDGSFLGVTQAGSVYGWFGSLTTADLDGDIRIGPPKRSRITDIVQPLVILNAPPTHFDIFNGVPYDVNKSYYPYQSLFIATYEENKEQKIEMETEFHRDWGVSAEISAGGGIKGFSVSGYLRGTYG